MSVCTFINIYTLLILNSCRWRNCKNKLYLNLQFLNKILIIFLGIYATAKTIAIDLIIYFFLYKKKLHDYYFCNFYLWKYSTKILFFFFFNQRLSCGLSICFALKIDNDIIRFAIKHDINQATRVNINLILCK